MRSKLRKVGRLWAIATTVRPRIRRSSASRIISSDSTSSAEVASSSSRIDASFQEGAPDGNALPLAAGQA